MESATFTSCEKLKEVKLSKKLLEKLVNKDDYDVKYYGHRYFKNTTVNKIIVNDKEYSLAEFVEKYGFEKFFDDPVRMYYGGVNFYIFNKRKFEKVTDVEKLIENNIITIDPNSKNTREEQINFQIKQMGRIVKMSNLANLEYDYYHECDYLYKMMGAIGLDETEKILKNPERIKIEDINISPEEISKFYDLKHSLSGDIPAVTGVFNELEKSLSKADRAKFYIELNSQLGQGNTKNISE